MISVDDDDYDYDTGPIAVDLRTRGDWIVYIASTLVLLGLAYAFGC